MEDRLETREEGSQTLPNPRSAVLLYKTKTPKTSIIRKTNESDIYIVVIIYHPPWEARNNSCLLKVVSGRVQHRKGTLLQGLFPAVTLRKNTVVHSFLQQTLMLTNTSWMYELQMNRQGQARVVSLYVWSSNSIVKTLQLHKTSVLEMKN